MTYNKMLEWCNLDTHMDGREKFIAIHGHRKAGGKWEVYLQWVGGEFGWNSLRSTTEDDPVTVAVYAKKN